MDELETSAQVREPIIRTKLGRFCVGTFGLAAAGVGKYAEHRLGSWPMPVGAGPLILEACGLGLAAVALHEGEVVSRYNPDQE